MEPTDGMIGEKSVLCHNGLIPTIIVIIHERHGAPTEIRGHLHHWCFCATINYPCLLYRQTT